MLTSSQLSLQEGSEGSSALSACMPVLALELAPRFAPIALGVLWGACLQRAGAGCQPGAGYDTTLVLSACLTLAEVAYMVTCVWFQ